MILNKKLPDISINVLTLKFDYRSIYFNIYANNTKSMLRKCCYIVRQT